MHNVKSTREDPNPIWRFPEPEIGVPPVLIHFWIGISPYKPSIWGYPPLWKPPIRRNRGSGPWNGIILQSAQSAKLEPHLPLNLKVNVEERKVAWEEGQRTSNPTLGIFRWGWLDFTPPVLCQGTPRVILRIFWKSGVQIPVSGYFSGDSLSNWGFELWTHWEATSHC